MRYLVSQGTNTAEPVQYHQRQDDMSVPNNLLKDYGDSHTVTGYLSLCGLYGQVMGSDTNILVDLST